MNLFLPLLDQMHPRFCHLYYHLCYIHLGPFSNSCFRLHLSLIGWIPGLNLGIIFLYGRVFCFKKLEEIQWIMLVLGIWKFWLNSLGLRFWKFSRIFENAWVKLICVGVSFSKSPNVLTLLRWSFWHIKSAEIIWFRFNPRNFNPRNFQFLVCFSFKTIFAPSRPRRHWYKKMWNFLAHLLSYMYVKSFPHHAPLGKHPRKSSKMDFRYSLPRKLVRVWYHFKWFLKLYNLSYSDSSFVNWVQKS